MSLPLKPWNQVRIALLGALLGAVYVYTQETGAHTMAEMLGALACGAAGGALLFGLFAAARNWTVARK